MNDRRAIIAIGGALVGVVGGIYAAANGAPVAGLLAALGALVAGLGMAFTQSADTPDDPSGTADGGGIPAAPPDMTVRHRTTVAAPSIQAPLLPASSDSGAPTATSPASAVPPAAAAPPTRRQSSAETPRSATPPASPPPAQPPEKPNLFSPPDVPTPPPSAGLLTDPETGLFSQDYFDIAIEARLAAARRHLRPVGVVLLEVIEGLREDRPRRADPVKVAESVRTTLREADTASRRNDGKFALLLEDTPENGAIWTVERIRRHLVEADPSLTVWAGVACYPAHAFDKESILRAADAALVAAREWHQDRIEVAIGE